ncbi:MAG: glycosyltransferase family 2 protein [Thermoanaerobaculia bacterium]
MNKALTKYLTRYAEPEAALAAGLPGTFGHALVVPAYGEEESLFRLLDSVPEGPRGEVLITVVLNARKASPDRVHEANQTARRRLAVSLPAPLDLSGEPPIQAYPVSRGKLLVIDRAVPGHFLPEGQGVGLARKIGNDTVLALFAAGRLQSPWLHNTDADTLLPRDYFGQLQGLDPDGVGSTIYFFDHDFDSDPTLAEAGRLYEISLRYYVLGLAWAGSPFAYQSMGSCLAVPAQAYAEVRGFPKKNAAEDFYVLNKLAKVGAILRLAGAPLRLEGRPSDRVPFGTGRALRNLVAKRGGLASFRLYHPLVFAHLAGWLRVLAGMARSGGDAEKLLAELPRANAYFRVDLLRESLERIGAMSAVREAIGRSRDEGTLLRHLHNWFDAFRTLKLVHALRDGGIRSLPWREALAEAPFTGLAGSTEDDVEALREALAQEERRLSESPAGLPSLGDA